MHCAPSTAHNIATSKMAAVLPTSAKRTNKGRFCRAKAFIRNNNAADGLTASWSVLEKQGNETNVSDPAFCSGFSIRGRRFVELSVRAEALDGSCEACGTALRLSNCINETVSALGLLLYVCCSNSEWYLLYSIKYEFLCWRYQTHKSNLKQAWSRVHTSNTMSFILCLVPVPAPQILCPDCDLKTMPTLHGRLRGNKHGDPRFFSR